MIFLVVQLRVPSATSTLSLSPDPERPDRTSETSHIIIRVGGVVCCLVRPSLFVVVAFPLFHVFFSARQLEAVGCAEKKVTAVHLVCGGLLGD